MEMRAAHSAPGMDIFLAGNLELIPDQCIVQAWEDNYLKPLNEYFKQQK